MDVRVITLRYQEGVQGFSEQAVAHATAGREVLEVREHFFTHGSVPHLALVLLLGDAPSGAMHTREGQRLPDAGEDLPEGQGLAPGSGKGAGAGAAQPVLPEARCAAFFRLYRPRHPSGRTCKAFPGKQVE
jgi:hypothetical protein